MANSGKDRDRRGEGISERYSYDYSGTQKKYQDGRGRTAHRSIVRFVKVLDVISVSIPFYVAWMSYYSHMVYVKDFYRRGNWTVMALFTVLYYLLAHLYSGFTIHISRISEIIYAQSLAALIAEGIM